FLDLNIEKTVKDINDIEGLLGGDDMDVELTRREGLNKDFWRQLHLKESLLKQKSRTRWVKEGDSNTRYFHESIKSRRRRNQLVALKDEDHWVQGVKEVKGFVKNFFENNFKENWENRPNLNGITFHSLSDEDNFSLMAPFTVDEVRDVIWSSDGNKSPGPDGFNFNFLKTCWEILKGDIMEFLSEFHDSASLPKAITASFLALIPKKDHPQCLTDYRPICLVSSMYKILSKVLAARLKKVMGKLISDVQSAFLPNRHILDGVLVVNELIDLAKRRKDKCLMFKVDFERAYDTVNWNFLEYMMTRMGFAEGWRRWIRACVFQSSMSVLVNGSTTDDFNVGKGLRQGDPLSPFLFLIVAEGLTGLMHSAVDRSLFHGYKVSNNISFHTLQFADDTIFVGEGNWDNLWTIKTVLRSFEIVSGLKVNFYKSKLYGINLEDQFLRASSSFLHCEVESIPFRFLGIPVGANPRRRATWLP
ncbi:cysteine-rich receptor-like protein kinase, partial [Trifolium pratense]